MSSNSDSNTPPAGNNNKPQSEKIQIAHAGGVKLDLSPPAGDAWLTEECQALLALVAQPWAGKKRTTIIILAHQLAAGEGYRQIFEQFADQLCTSSNWFGKWQHLPDVAAAFKACRLAATEAVATETAAQIAEYRRQKQLNIARFAALGPAALSNVMANKAGQYKGAEVINAVKTLFEWDDPNTGMTLKTNTGSLSVDQSVNFAGMTDQELAQIAGGQPPADSVDSEGAGE